MTIVQFFRVLNKNLNLLLLCSLALAVLVFFFTRNLPKTYASKTEIYTGLASGSSVDAIGGKRVDWAATTNEFDNLFYVIKSEQTLSEVGEILFSKHLIELNKNPESEKIGESTIEFLNNIFPIEERDTLLVPESETMTLKNVKKLKEQHIQSWAVQQIFQNPISPYSFAALSSLEAGRIKNSDLVAISYQWTNPYTCQLSLSILNEVFAKKLLEIKIGQTNDIIKYFRDQTRNAKIALQNKEDTLKDFRIEHKIINYDQQTENIAALQNQLEGQYQTELRNRAASAATVRQLDQKLKLNKKLIALSDELLRKKNKLTTLNAEIAKLEVLNYDGEKLAELHRQAQTLEAELSNSVFNRYQHTKTKEGISVQKLLQEWIAATIELDATNAKLEVLANRSEYFQKSYNQFSPLGSELGRLERSVDLAEQKYLSLHNSLNTALTKQQSESLSTSGIFVTVPPKLPLAPEKSKQMLLVLVSAVVGFVFPFMIIVLIEFLDSTVHSPIRGEELTGLKLLGAYPDLTPRSEYKNIKMEWLVEKSVGHLAQNLRLEARGLADNKSKPKTILTFSTRTSEGKSVVNHELSNSIEKLGKKVLVVSYKEYPFDDEEKEYQQITYTHNNDFLNKSSVFDLIDPSIRTADFDFIILDIKGILSEQYPIEMVEKFDIAICVLSSKRAWNKADRFALNEFKETLNVEPRLIVNAVDPDYLDMVIGEISKTRSALRKFIKATLTMQFHNEKIAAEKQKEKEFVKPPKKKKNKKDNDTSELDDELESEINA